MGRIADDVYADDALVRDRPQYHLGRSQLSLLIVAKEAAHSVYLVGGGVCVGGGLNGWLAESLVGIQLRQ